MTGPAHHAGFEAHFLYNPPFGPSYCHSATVLESRTGDVLVSWYAYPREETRNASLVITKRPAGQGWDRSRLVLPQAGSSLGNPTLFEDSTGRISLLYVALAEHYWDSAVLHGTSSLDGGRTWSPPEMMLPQRGLMVRHAPVPLEDGSLLLPGYEEKPPRTVLLRSAGHATKWSEAYRFDGWELIQPVLVRRAPQSLALFFRPSNDSRCVWRSFSSDEGRSWSDPIRTPLPNPLSGIAAFSVDGRDTIVLNPSPDNRHRLAMAHSENAGVSWSEPRSLDDAEMEVSYPAFALGSAGRVHGVYTYNRRMIKYVSFPADWWRTSPQ